jgi:diguanylate cyclase (GGDEF)-like protein
LRGIISPPPDLFARVRRGLMTLNLVLGMSLLYLLAQSADTLVNAQTLACAALVWLGCFWIYVYRNVTISPAWDLGVALSLLAVGLSIDDPVSTSGLLYLAVLYGGLCYRSFTLSSRAVAGTVFLYAAVHVVSIGYTMGLLTGGSSPLIGLLQAPGLAVSAGATHALARSLSARRQPSSSLPLTMLETDILRQVFHDDLTGLPNRTLFMNRLESALANARERGDSIVVLFLDLDRFKVVNDSLGHDAGNQLLISVAARIQTVVRPSDTVARLSGDEFAVLIDCAGGVEPPVDVAQRILYALREPTHIDGYDVVASTSIGIAFAAHDDLGETASDLLRNADLAMYEAKNRGRGNYAVFHPLMNARALHRLEMETELRYAVTNSEFQVYYQPLVQLRTGRVVEVEALVRWQHPSRGLLLPDTFISLAEETGLIEPIGQWVLEEACRQGQIWEKQRPGAPPLNLNVNLSVRQFQQPNLVTDIARVLKQTKIAPRQLTLEITESVALADAEAAVATMKELKGLGLQLAIDDFGTGYSALSYLKRFPVDTLKIDRSFIEGLNYDHGDVAIVRAVIAFAKTMNLSVTAEGVETPDQLRHLEALGCDRGQGYYFATPLPSVELSLDAHYGDGLINLVSPPKLAPITSIHRSA